MYIRAMATAAGTRHTDKSTANRERMRGRLQIKRQKKKKVNTHSMNSNDGNITLSTKWSFLITKLFPFWDWKHIYSSLMNVSEPNKTLASSTKCYLPHILFPFLLTYVQRKKKKRWKETYSGTKWTQRIPFQWDMYQLCYCSKATLLLERIVSCVRVSECVCVCVQLVLFWYMIIQYHRKTWIYIFAVCVLGFKRQREK